MSTPETATTTAAPATATAATTPSPSPGPWVDENRYMEEPFPLVNDLDDRPAVRDLIEQHKEKIQKVRTNLEQDPLYDPIKHDALWIMRYILSHKKVDKATTAAKKFILYRKQKQLDEADIRNDPPGLNCKVEGVRKWWACNDNDALIFCHPDQDRGVVMFLKLKGIDQNKVAQIQDDEWPFWYFMEWMFQVLDATTRRTGRLTKGIRFVDLGAFSLRQNNRECINRNAKNARECQDHYPQMLASVYVIHVIAIFQGAYRLIKPLLPKRFVEKLNIINPVKNKKEKALLLKHISEENLPIRFGGLFEEWPYPSHG
eukprot:CAMPEP_0119013202 /NCGR_PEP_ID=MMETSP1176-20130426/8128_1 /TAXON_ID=265551 /ORGANISM="Synedropsis recta cf, Strain CCMP1620" /LENGTH=314 /DNA_ID=CAMNT_0006966265 /DNA_START=39 /DNA_END=983 /DNA_ORIENTATION=+